MLAVFVVISITVTVALVATTAELDSVILVTIVITIERMIVNSKDISLIIIVLYDSNCDKDDIDLLNYSDDCNDRNN